MRATLLEAIGLEHLRIHEQPVPEPGPGELLVRLRAASLNPRDLQILTGQFTPNLALPLVPLSDGAGEVVARGEGVVDFAEGDLVTPLFFPDWVDGEATAGERSRSLGLELPCTLRDYAVFPASAVVRAAPHLSPAEAACFPCAGLTAWYSLVEKSSIGAGSTVVLQGTGGVAMAGLQFAKALGARAIVLSSSDERLEVARRLGADHTINYRSTPDWGEEAFEFAGHGVDAVLEIGGTQTLAQSLAAIRHGGHINIIGYMSGAELGVTVFPLIIRNANLHGIGTGHRAAYTAMMACVAEHGLRPWIHDRFPFEAAREGLETLARGGHLGKLVIDFGD